MAGGRKGHHWELLKSKMKVLAVAISVLVVLYSCDTKKQTQTEAVADNPQPDSNSVILEFSLFDAIRAGFKNAVIVFFE